MDRLQRQVPFTAAGLMSKPAACRTAPPFPEEHQRTSGCRRWNLCGDSPPRWAHLADVISQLGRFDEAIRHAAVQIAEAADHPFTLYSGLFDLGRLRGRLYDYRGSRRRTVTIVPINAMPTSIVA